DNLYTQDDAVFFWIDTYHDKRTAYGFAINPVNTQTDFRISDDGRVQNYEWDGEWQSATQKHSWGWSAEIAIPFKILQFNRNDSVWGVNFGRIVRNKSEISWWSGEVSDNFLVSQGGSITGLELPTVQKRFIITPYASVRYEDSDLTKEYNKTKFDGGGDIKINITPNIAANATINPDFASVEGDQVQIDLTGWEINFPEKRLFFQEGNEMFSLRYSPFYSRRIGDIDYGGKITGKTGPVSFNVLNTHTVEKDSLTPAAFYTAARVKTDIFKSSSVGAIVVDKSAPDTNFARSYGTDWSLNPGKQWKITGQVLGSAPGNTKNNLGGFMRVAHESNKHHVHLRYSNLGKNFKDNINQTGFIQDDDRHELDADLIYTFWLKKSFIQYIKFSNKNNIYWTQEGSLKGYKFRDELKIYLHNNWSYRLYYDNRYLLRSVKDSTGNKFKAKFYNYYFEHTLGYNTDASSHATLSYTHGRNFGREMKIIKAHTCVSPFAKLNLKYNYVNLQFSPDTIAYQSIRLERSTQLHVLSADYYFTNNLWIRLFAQHNSIDDMVYFYGQFGWRFKPPFGALYFIYIANDGIDIENDAYYNHQTAFLKITYPLSW
ncbi:MAG: DUF5916 domain-containing protein, partial [Bacteroidales bacterium]|nr:DUF5916 domain-containing protein [Bacteroidales bacterium]